MLLVVGGQRLVVRVEGSPQREFVVDNVLGLVRLASIGRRFIAHFVVGGRARCLVEVRQHLDLSRIFLVKLVRIRLGSRSVVEFDRRPLLLEMLQDPVVDGRRRSEVGGVRTDGLRDAAGLLVLLGRRSVSVARELLVRVRLRVLLHVVSHVGS